MSLSHSGSWLYSEVLIANDELVRNPGLRQLNGDLSLVYSQKQVK